MSFLKKLFGNGKNTKDGLATPVEEVRQSREGFVSVGKSIYPIIKNADDQKIQLAKNVNPIITRPLAEKLVVCYLLDFGDNFEMISQNHLRDLNLTADDIHAVAIRNMVNKINAGCKIGKEDYSNVQPAIKPFYSIHTDENLNPSIMLIDEFWEQAAKQFVTSDTIAVTIPAKNTIYFSDMKVMESFRTMRPIASQMFDLAREKGIELSTDTYIRKNGKWILFLDTEEQMAELW